MKNEDVEGWGGAGPGAKDGSATSLLARSEEQGEADT